MMKPYPLVLCPTLIEAAWGSDTLARYGKQISAGARIGRSIELFDDLVAGGGESSTFISNGELAGKPLHEVLHLWGGAMLPRAALTARGKLPVTISFVDAADATPLFLHAGPSLAQTDDIARSRQVTTCWYVLESRSGSIIGKGWREGVTEIEVSAALSSPHANAQVAHMLEPFPAVAGDCHVLPPGVPHAARGGVLLLEVRSNSGAADLQRLVNDRVAPSPPDSSRGATGLSIPIPPVASFNRPGMVRGGVKTEGFSVFMYAVSAGSQGMCEPFTLNVILGGSGQIRAFSGDAYAALSVKAGDTVFMPAHAAHAAMIPDSNCSLTWLKVAFSVNVRALMQEP